MTIGGWIMLVVSWTAITGLVVFALWRTVRGKPSDLTAPLEIEEEIERSEAEKDRAGTD